jgi:hypothetical protein
LWVACGRHETEAAHDLGPDRDAAHHGLARKAALLGDRQDRGHHDGARMDGPALEGVVVILAVRRRAVDEGGIIQPEAPAVAERRAGPLVDGARERRRHVVGLPRRDRQSGDIEDEAPADGLRGLRRAGAGHKGGDLQRDGRRADGMVLVHGCAP